MGIIIVWVIGMDSRISEEELKKVLATAAPSVERKDPKRAWVERMLRSAKIYHKICPYFDKKTGGCFIKQLKTLRKAKCDRDGRFEGCSVFVQFLEEVYDKIKAQGGVLPMDFRDIPMVF